MEKPSEVDTRSIIDKWGKGPEDNKNKEELVASLAGTTINGLSFTKKQLELLDMSGLENMEKALAELKDLHANLEKRASDQAFGEAVAG